MLFDLVDRLPKQVQPFQPTNKGQNADRLEALEDVAPVILFPMQDTEIIVSEIGSARDAIDILVQTEGGKPRVYVDSEPIVRGRNGYRFVAPSPGFYTMKVVDTFGRETRSRFRVLASDDLTHPGL